MSFKALLEEQCGQLCLGEGPNAGRKSLMQKKAEKQNDVQNAIYFSATTFALLRAPVAAHVVYTPALTSLHCDCPWLPEDEVK